jgi:hypothetical protein
MQTSTQEIDFSADMLDVRDIIARFEEIEGSTDQDEKEEAQSLQAVLDELKGCGGDEQWRGDWYPVMLVNDSYFEDYAQELAEDCGMVNKDATWPNNHINWEEAAGQLKEDYTSIDIDGGDNFWYR